MKDPIREAFERVSVPNFIAYPAHRNLNGEYSSAVIEDAWQTFQEGWEEALKYQQIKAGAEIHAGGGGYREGTKEGYEAFVKARNYSYGDNK